MVRLLKHIAFATALTCLFVSVYSCGNDNGCEENKSSLPLAGFYSSQTKASITVDSLTVFGIGMPGDTVIADTARINKVYMPFNLEDTVTRFVFRYDQSDLAAYDLSDTITISYERIPYFHSEECGAMFVYGIHNYDYSTNLIDSVRIDNLRIDNTNKKNIKIFFRTVEEENQ